MGWNPVEWLTDMYSNVYYFFTNFQWTFMNIIKVLVGVAIIGGGIGFIFLVRHYVMHENLSFSYIDLIPYGLIVSGIVLLGIAIIGKAR